MNEVFAFIGKYRFLSNFCRSPIKYKGKTYKTAEHLYQALKTKNRKQRAMIRKCKTPRDAKRKGQNILLRSDFQQVKNNLMLMVVRLKFLQNPMLKIWLKNTKDKKLTEGNRWHDNYWGDCSCSKCKKIKGQNQLGKTLMKIRIIIGDF